MVARIRNHRFPPTAEIQTEALPVARGRDDPHTQSGAVGDMAHGPMLAPVVHRHLPAVRSACASIRATRTAGPLLWTTGTTTSAEYRLKKDLPVHKRSNQLCSGK